MQLPSIDRAKRFALPRPIGSADALLLARHALERAAAGQLLCIVAANPADVQRLADELPFFAPALRIAVFPDWETLPYDNFSPHQDLISERLATLWQVQSGGVDVVLLPATTALTRLAPPGFMAGYTFHFQQKMRLNEAALKAQLTLAGYSHVSQVVSPGEYAVRGGLIDLFPMGSPVPYRVDLFGDEVDSIRTFDPDTQRSLYPVPEVRLLPGREFPMDEAARNAFRARWREQIEGDPSRHRVYKDIGAGIATAGIEYYLPLFFEHTATIFDYLGAGTAVPPQGSAPSSRNEGRATGGKAPMPAALVLHGEINDALQHFWADTRERHRFLRHDPERPVLPPEALFLPAEDFFTRANEHATLLLRGSGEPVWARPLPDVSVERGATEPLAALERHLDTTPHRVLLVAESEGRRESLLELLRDHRIDVPSVATLAEFEAGDRKVAIAAAPLAAGFHWHESDARISIHLRLEFRWDKGNSGVQVRDEISASGKYSDTRLKLPRPTSWASTGTTPYSTRRTRSNRPASRMSTAGEKAVIEKDGTRANTKLKDAAEVQAKYKEHEWNTMEIIAKGDRLVQKINGVHFATLIDQDAEMSRAEGLIAFQDHGKGCTVAFGTFA